MLTMKQFRSIQSAVDSIYDTADTMGFSWPVLAKKAGLAYSTVWNLGRYETRFPRTQTIFMLAKAVGMEFVLKSAEQPKKRKLRLVG
jgi:hypothetical protein